ncbi:CBS domain-containing protein [Halomonas sp. MCCC 1A17488]|uniref:CBS domain-containing protein n=1 Tax=Billgrantia sulfidoxydans TaxID=2733484 RepID=A0ABX7W5N0_9GAMM|nr:MULTISPECIES: CBS domain-containing protein [Halomonas]MCE8016046.1 CBS domain-containing protein [Halomonas sp. MCCC 1A17488]MCG3239379.1 CBS domain-containing protein [Halomonas sp. MCCC 1A17488]QPP50691.1 CBS domain-containing protein [Halomonas sp. SS10-MC5]QTP54269.1 CBS domain-containing protein [Halomonas sulfidoxydans]
MQAVDVMTPKVITVSPDADVREIARLLLENNISAVPVVDAEERVLGIVSEGDLMRRVGSGSEQSKSWWLKAFFTGGNSASEYVKTHARKAHEIMTRDPITIGEDESLQRVAKLLEKHHIKRVPVVRDGRLVGIVSRANLLRGFSATAPDAQTSVTTDDRQIRDAILKEVDENTGVWVDRINVIVTEGVVQVWGLVESQEEKMAVQVAAENTPGVKSVENNLGMVPRGVGHF